MVYNIVCVSDLGYVQHAAVMLCSLFENNPNYRFCIYFITDPASYKKIRTLPVLKGKTCEQLLSALCIKYHAKLKFCPCSLEGIKDLPVGQWTTFMYLKLFMPLVIPQSEKRCLFLDVDMIVNDDIRSLYEMDLGGSALAATEDIPDCVQFRPRLNLKETDYYINSGVMVCDLDLWRRLYNEKDIFEFIRSIATRIQNEQDVIACYFKDRIKLLPIRWNMVTFYFMRVPKIFSKYLNDLPEAKMNPGIIHFAAPIKPWFKDCNHPYQWIYKKYCRLTAWKNYRYTIFEKLSVRKKFTKHVRFFLNRLNILKDPMFLKID